MLTELNALYPGRLSVFVSLNQVSLSTIISGFIFDPSIHYPILQIFLFYDFIFKLKINKQLKLVQQSLKEFSLPSLKIFRNIGNTNQIDLKVLQFGN